MDMKKLKEVIDKRQECFCHRVGTCTILRAVVEYAENLEERIAKLEKSLEEKKSESRRSRKKEEESSEE